MNAPLKRPPLPDSWVERIFDRMQGLYGSLWLDRWRNGETVERNGQRFDRGLLLAKATWAEDLAGFADHPERIAKALDSCRNKAMPPTLPEFLAICRQQHEELPPALPAPRMSADEVAPKVAAAAKAVAKRPQGDREWAKKLRAQYLAKHHLLPVQVQLASAALGEVWADGACRPVWDASA